MKTFRTFMVVLALLLVSLMPLMAKGAKEALAEEEAAETVATTQVEVQTTAPQVTVEVPTYGVVNQDDLYSKFSYSYGYYITGSLVDQGISLNSAYYLRGLSDGYLYGTQEPLIAQEAMADTVQEYIDNFYSQGMSAEAGDVLSMDAILALPAPTELVDRFSYAYGYMYMVQLYLYNGLDILCPEFLQGSVAAIYNTEPVMDFNTMQANIDEYAAYLDAQYAEYQAQMGAANLEAANAFFEANKSVEGFVAVNDYVLMQIIAEDEELGASPEATDSVVVDYALYLMDGTQADAGTDVTFSLTSLIPGFTEACVNMKVGQEALVYIHPDHGYGARDLGTIPSNSLLIFDITLKGIVK